MRLGAFLSLLFLFICAPVAFGESPGVNYESEPLIDSEGDSCIQPPREGVQGNMTVHFATASTVEGRRALPAHCVFIQFEGGFPGNGERWQDSFFCFSLDLKSVQWGTQAQWDGLEYLGSRNALAGETFSFLDSSIAWQLVNCWPELLASYSDREGEKLALSIPWGSSKKTSAKGWGRAGNPNVMLLGGDGYSGWLQRAGFLKRGKRVVDAIPSHLPPRPSRPRLMIDGLNSWQIRYLRKPITCAGRSENGGVRTITRWNKETGYVDYYYDVSGKIGRRRLENLGLTPEELEKLKRELDDALNCQDLVES